tara:strand:- start:411 stop:785 length:375 start_codon:yes stop_codon:yes gene_type:complete
MRSIRMNGRIAVYLRRAILIDNLFNPVRNQIMKRLIRRDGAACKACGSKNDLTIDHIDPTSFGGAILDPENMQLLCKWCNSEKSREEESRHKIITSMNLRFMEERERVAPARFAPHRPSASAWG